MNELSAFLDELEKLATPMTYKNLAAIGAGTGVMLNLGGRAKNILGVDYSPKQKGRTMTGDAARSAAAAVALGAVLNALSKGKVT